MLVASCAWSARFHASRLPATSAVINNGFVIFINFASVVFSDPTAPNWNGGMFCQTRTVPKGYKLRKTFAAALTVRSMSAGVCAVEIKPASNCDGAR